MRGGEEPSTVQAEPHVSARSLFTNTSADGERLDHAWHMLSRAQKQQVLAGDPCSLKTCTGWAPLMGSEAQRNAAGEKAPEHGPKKSQEGKCYHLLSNLTPAIPNTEPLNGYPQKAGARQGSKAPTKTDLLHSTLTSQKRASGAEAALGPPVMMWAVQL